MKSRQRRSVSLDVGPEQRATLDRILAALPRAPGETPIPAPAELPALFYHPNTSARMLALTLSAGYDAASGRSDAADKKIERAQQVYTLVSEDGAGRRHLDELRRLATTDATGFLGYLHDSAVSFLRRSMDSTGHQFAAPPAPAQPRVIEEGEGLPEEKRARSGDTRPARTPHARRDEPRDEPRGDRDHGDEPRGEGDESQGDHPQGDRPQGDRPRGRDGDRDRGDRPRGRDGDRDRPPPREPRRRDRDEAPREPSDAPPDPGVFDPDAEPPEAAPARRSRRRPTRDDDSDAAESIGNIGDDEAAAAAAAALAAIEAPYEDVVEDDAKPRFDPDRDLVPDDGRRGRGDGGRRRRARGPEGLERPRPDTVKEAREDGEESELGDGDDRPRRDPRPDRPPRDDRPREDRPPGERREGAISVSRVCSAPELAELALDAVRQALRIARERGVSGRVRLEFTVAAAGAAPSNGSNGGPPPADRGDRPEGAAPDGQRRRRRRRRRGGEGAEG